MIYCLFPVIINQIQRFNPQKFNIQQQQRTKIMKKQQQEMEQNKKQKRRGTMKITESEGPPENLYNPLLSILTIGDGDLTFSLSISQWFSFKYSQNPKNFIATTYDSLEDLIALYHLSVKNNIEKLNKNLVKIYHQIDVNKLPEYQQILDPNYQKFDRIVWNFPHAGFPEKRIGPGFQWEEGFHKKHIDLLEAFFKYSKLYLKPNGKILMAHKTVEPFSIWDLPGLAQKHGYKLISNHPFMIQNYPGYENRRGAGKNGGKRFPMQDAVQYVFEQQYKQL